METQQTSKEPKEYPMEALEEWLECPSCHYQWSPMVENPVMCPECKKRFSVAKNILPIKIKHVHMSIRQRKNPLRMRPFEAHEHGTTLCVRCVELDPTSSVYAIAETEDHKFLCEKHIIEACMNTRFSRPR